jgi:BirA family transcriptional regulator, biotin operon repressor / biotin---[acetyl-CoA-carboxylase] ligase
MEPDPKVLVPFLEAGSQFVSGARIARSLDVSRVSVHHHLEALRRRGFSFDAIRNRGYRLSGEPEAFNQTLFKALLAVEPCPFFRDYLLPGEVDSTNSVAETELAAARPDPFAVVATAQTAGRGRRGRIWHSPRDRNLYLTVALRPSLPPARLQTITLWLGLRLARFLRDALGLPMQVKWPNDLMLQGRKVAGMLTEARVDSEATRDLVFGLGLNVNATEQDFPPELREIAGSLALSLGRPLNLSRLAHRLVHQTATAISDYLDGDYAPELESLWPEFDYLRGQRVHAGELGGTANGITATGSLRILRDDGSSAILHAGEVSLKN